MLVFVCTGTSIYFFVVHCKPFTDTRSPQPPNLNFNMSKKQIYIGNQKAKIADAEIKGDFVQINNETFYNYSFCG